MLVTTDTGYICVFCFVHMQFSSSDISCITWLYPSYKINTFSNYYKLFFNCLLMYFFLVFTSNHAIVLNDITKQCTELKTHHKLKQSRDLYVLFLILSWVASLEYKLVYILFLNHSLGTNKTVTLLALLSSQE